MRKLKIVLYWALSFIFISVILEIIGRFAKGNWIIWCNEVSDHFMFLGLPLLIAVVYLKDELGEW